MAELIKNKGKTAIIRRSSKFRRTLRPPVKTFKQQKPGFFRRLLRMVFNPLTFGVAGLLLLGVFLTATYFWFEYSDRINILLSGEVFTRSSGIYSAPKTLRKGEKITKDDLVEYLKTAGYVKKDRKADPLRSRYEVTENEISIEPGNTAIIDGKRDYRNLSVKFDKKGKTEAVASITDQDSEEELNKTPIEPELLSSIAAEGDGRRKVITFKDLPPQLIDAITVTEDRAFFEHYGVNFRGIARALWRRYDGENEGSSLENQGGSSITQQLIKNLLLTPERSYERKAKEAYMSLILETRLSKEEIFTLYANQIYLGQSQGVSIYGVGEAANIYFDKDVSALTLAESAFIAGIIRSPNRYNPFKNPEKTKQRRNQVLDSMVETKTVSYDKAKKAKETELALKEKVSKKDLLGMPYFSQYAIEQLPKIVTDPEALQHLRVYTTIDPDLQELAYKTVNKRLAKLEKYYKKEKRGNLNAALVSIRPKTGEIVAMVGGKNFLENQFNRATDAMRQPGSVFKPFVYATAINTSYDSNSRVITPATIFRDEKKVFSFNQDTYSPNNYGDFFSNQDITLRDALVKSKNVITVDLAMQLNIGKVMNLAHRAGLPKIEKAYPSMALGTAEATPLQMAEAYTMFANLGDTVSPIAINRVTTGDGETIAAPVGEKKNVLRPDVAYIMNDMMKDVLNRGTAAQIRAWGFKNVDGKRGYAGKTGTSRDGWFAGFTPELVTIVYVGFDDGSNLNLKGSDSAMPIWAEFMRDALNLHPEWNGDWQMPATIQRAEIDIRNGTVIRDLNDTENINTDQPENATAKNNPVDINSSNVIQDAAELYITNIPSEFRRAELFIRGSVPNKMLLPVTETPTEIDFEDSSKPKATPTPFTTWEEADEQKGNEKQNSGLNSVDKITIMWCPVSHKRANANCPDMQAKIFLRGTEPKEICKFHLAPPQR